MLSWRASKRVTILGMMVPEDGEFIARVYPVGCDERVGAVDEDACPDLKAGAHAESASVRDAHCARPREGETR